MTRAEARYWRLDVALGLATALRHTAWGLDPVLDDRLKAVQLRVNALFGTAAAAYRARAGQDAAEVIDESPEAEPK